MLTLHENIDEIVAHIRAFMFCVPALFCFLHLFDNDESVILRVKCSVLAWILNDWIRMEWNHETYVKT